MTSATTTSTSPPSSSSGQALRLPAEVEVTARVDGDLNVLLPERGDVAWARQVHGATAVVVDVPGCAGDADALVTTSLGLRLAVRAADCAPVVLAAMAGREPCLAVAHVGWRGARAGVVSAAADEVRRLSGSTEVAAWLGPCIGSCCYRFGSDDLDEVAAVLGEGVRATTTTGEMALDLTAAVAAAAALAGVSLTGSDGRCTACHLDQAGRPAFFSHRARGDVERHGVMAWLR